MVLQFHMLPNPIPTDQFVNGYSFNTVRKKKKEERRRRIGTRGLPLWENRERI